MKILIIHPHGNQNVNRVVSLFKKLNVLDCFWTTITFLLKFRFKFFKDKYYIKLSFKKIKLLFMRELLRNFFTFFRLKKLYINEGSFFSVYSVYKDLDLNASSYINNNAKKINIIYSYEDCALNSFQQAKYHGIKTVYDLTSPYWKLKKKILDYEIKLHPEWNLSATEIITDIKSINKDQEILLSDQIIVASKFTAESLQHYSKKILNINIIPYGVTESKNFQINKRTSNEKLKIIFAGRPIVSKGIHYIVETLRNIDLPWQLEIAGSITEKPEQISKNLLLFLKDSRCNFLGQIKNDKLLERIKNSHVFLFPSLYEGFGQVLLEAASLGVPIITTENTGAPDFIADKKNGFITPIRDIIKTTEILHELYKNENYRMFIAQNSFQTSKKFTWTNYQNKLKEILFK